MTYSMMFAVSATFDHVLLLQKPHSHHNPLFRGRWTAPGGKVEPGESEKAAAVREMEEEAQIRVSPDDVRFVLRFACNCDPTESEHDVAVFGVAIPIEQMTQARGAPVEPVGVFSKLPESMVWYTRPLLELVTARLKQPVVGSGASPQWICENPDCRATFAEYINGCPRCYDLGLHYSVRQEKPGQPSDSGASLESRGLTDTGRLDWLNERTVDVMYLDDGTIIDVCGNDIRATIDRCAAPDPTGAVPPLLPQCSHGNHVGYCAECEKTEAR